jgi:hypothetical protein
VRVDGKVDDDSLMLMGEGGERRLEGGQQQLKERRSGTWRWRIYC